MKLHQKIALFSSSILAASLLYFCNPEITLSQNSPQTKIKPQIAQHQILKDKQNNVVKLVQLLNSMNYNNTISKKEESQIYGFTDDAKYSDADDNYLAENCKGRCLYYSDEDGLIRIANAPIILNTPSLGCVGKLKGDGWVLFDKDGELIIWGKNIRGQNHPYSLTFFEENSCNN